MIFPRVSDLGLLSWERKGVILLVFWKGFSGFCVEDRLYKKDRSGSRETARKPSIMAAWSQDSVVRQQPEVRMVPVGRKRSLVSRLAPMTWGRKPRKAEEWRWAERQCRREGMWTLWITVAFSLKSYAVSQKQDFLKAWFYWSLLAVRGKAFLIDSKIQALRREVYFSLRHHVKPAFQTMGSSIPQGI